MCLSYGYVLRSICFGYFLYLVFFFIYPFTHSFICFNSVLFIYLALYIFCFIHLCICLEPFHSFIFCFIHLYISFVILFFYYLCNIFSSLVFVGIFSFLFFCFIRPFNCFTRLHSFLGPVSINAVLFTLCLPFAATVCVFWKADRLLELGFQEEVSELVRSCPLGRQTLLFSATMNTKVDDLAALALNKVHYLHYWC